MPNFVSNQPSWPKYFELSLGTIFFKLSDPKTFKKIKVTNFNMQKILIFTSLEKEPVYMGHMASSKYYIL